MIWLPVLPPVRPAHHWGDPSHKFDNRKLSSNSGDDDDDGDNDDDGDDDQRPGRGTSKGIILRFNLTAWSLRQVDHWLEKISCKSNLVVFDNFKSVLFTWFRYCLAGLGGGPGWIVRRLNMMIMMTAMRDSWSSQNVQCWKLLWFWS